MSISAPRTSWCILLAMPCIESACDREPTESSPAGDPCDIILIHSDNTAECSNSQDARCEQALQDDTVVFLWRLKLRDTTMIEDQEGSVSQGELDTWVSCLTNELDQAESVGVNQYFDETWVNIRATSAVVGPLLDLSMIESFDVECIDDDYCDCRERDLDSCQDNAFCDMISGSPVDSEQQCVADRESAGCGVQNGCGDVVVMAINIESYQCWLFYTDCLPGGFVETNDEAFCTHEMWGWEPCP